jgi:hypothetical protein
MFTPYFLASESWENSILFWKPRSLLEVVIWQGHLISLSGITEIVGMYLIQRLKMMKIKDIIGKSIEVTNLNKAIKQCKLCRNSPFLMDSGHTVGENHTFMLQQLEGLKRKTKT